MSISFAAARAVSAISTFGLKNIFHRPAANFPGKMALYVDPQLIGHLRSRLSTGSIVVVGTNGKTTVTNLLADVIERAGKTVVCNRTGANLDSGVATSLLHAKQADWGVFETDELWMAKILPQLRANYVVLLNLFRDQLDRVGEIDRIQDSIVGALESSPETVLVYNADDPLCAVIADRVDNLSLAFGVGESMGLPQNSVADATMCQKCSSMFEYEYRQYGQLGKYHCTGCGFERPHLDFLIENTSLTHSGLAFSLQGPANLAAHNEDLYRITASFTGAYMVYNLAAVTAVSLLLHCSNDVVQESIDTFNPKNGRLQQFEVAGRSVLLNLAKNPTGFNQNLSIIMQDSGAKSVCFLVNDKEGDGRDVSWLWDIDFEELAESADLHVYAGGIRGNDVQVRLKYAGIESVVVTDTADFLSQISGHSVYENAYVIANYTALPSARVQLEQLSEEKDKSPLSTAENKAADNNPSPEPVIKGQKASDSEPVAEVPTLLEAAEESSQRVQKPLVIAHLFPDLLNLYGDGGNVKVLTQRLVERGIPVYVQEVHYGESLDYSQVDLVFLGGGPDREQRLASDELMRMKDDIKAFVEDEGALLAICGGYQILGSKWLLADEEVDGLGVLPLETRRTTGVSSRLIDNIVLKSRLANMPVVGYENHAGRTYLKEGAEPFGHVVSSVGHGNNDTDRVDGVLYKQAVGTYLHGPLLAKNPQVADSILASAIKRYALRVGIETPTLTPLDDSVEKEANAHLCKRFGVS